MKDGFHRRYISVVFNRNSKALLAHIVRLSCDFVNRIKRQDAKPDYLAIEDDQCGTDVLPEVLVENNAFDKELKIRYVAVGYGNFKYYINVNE